MYIGPVFERESNSIIFMLFVRIRICISVKIMFLHPAFSGLKGTLDPNRAEYLFINKIFPVKRNRQSCASYQRWDNSDSRATGHLGTIGSMRAMGAVGGTARSAILLPNYVVRGPPNIFEQN